MLIKLRLSKGINLFLCRVPVAFGHYTFIWRFARVHRVEQERFAHFLLQTLVPIGVISIPHESDDGSGQLQTCRQEHHRCVLLVNNAQKPIICTGESLRNKHQIENAPVGRNRSVTANERAKYCKTSANHQNYYRPMQSFLI